MGKDDGFDLITEMILQAAKASDTDKALSLMEHCMVELSPEDEAELKIIYGDDYSDIFEDEEPVLQ